MLQQISIQDTRNNLASLVSQTSITGKQFIITKFGKPAAMIVPVVVDDFNKKNAALDTTFGVWKDREDIKDSAKWVANLRMAMSLRK